MMTNQQGQDHRGVLNAIAAWVKSYREALGQRNEMANCTPEQVAAIARDMGLTSGELLSITAKGPHAAGGTVGPQYASSPNRLGAWQ